MSFYADDPEDLDEDPPLARLAAAIFDQGQALWEAAIADVPLEAVLRVVAPGHTRESVEFLIQSIGGLNEAVRLEVALNAPEHKEASSDG